MKELRELTRDLREDHDVLYKVGTDYLLSTSTENHRELARYLQYLRSVEEYEVSRKQPKG